MREVKAPAGSCICEGQQDGTNLEGGGVLLGGDEAPSEGGNLEVLFEVRDLDVVAGKQSLVARRVQGLGVRGAEVLRQGLRQGHTVLMNSWAAVYNLY